MATPNYPFTLTKHSIHFTGLQGYDYQLVFNLITERIRLFKRVPESNKWDEAVSSTLTDYEKSGELHSLIGSDRKNSLLDGLNKIMAMIALERLM